MATLYLQGVLGYSPSFADLAGLPFSLSVILGSVLGSWLAGRVGGRATMSSGLAVVAVAPLVATGVSAEGGVVYVLLGVALSGLGLGYASVASTARGTSAVAKEDRGLASGLLNTSAQVGTALGLAVLVTIAAAYANAVSGEDAPAAKAIVDGYRLAFFIGAGIAVLGVLAALSLIRRDETRSER